MRDVLFNERNIWQEKAVRRGDIVYFASHYQRVRSPLCHCQCADCNKMTNHRWRLVLSTLCWGGGGGGAPLVYSDFGTSPTTILVQCIYSEHGHLARIPASYWFLSSLQWVPRNISVEWYLLLISLEQWHVESAYCSVIIRQRDRIETVIPWFCPLDWALSGAELL